jgi:alkylation response protein AidB-like acyl-CoA dehydrogenase
VSSGVISSPLAERLDAAVARLEALDLPDRFDGRAPRAVVEAGLHLLPVPEEHGGLGAGMELAAQVLARLGAVDGSTALGFAMHVHVLGAAAASEGWPPDLLTWLFEEVARSGALVNAASTEEGGGSPARGAIPGTTATESAGGYRLDGEKTWTTWLPALRHALVTARLADGSDPPRVGLFLVDLEAPGVDRRPGFEALGMRGSASGRLVLDGVDVPLDRLVQVRGAGGPDPRGPAPGAWFGLVIAATYLGVGEGARRNVARWALDRRPGDGSTSVAEIPTIQVRLGRLDAGLRAARSVLLDVARRWDAAAGDRTVMQALGSDIALAKLVATRAAVEATDEALRIAGGPGFLAGRLERAFRDARAGLVNPPLEDVAYREFARKVLDDAGPARRDRS